ncbi:hypothetical protein CHELA20_53552 [Hyphomicrobiales bacterium]|nr:hypothetical protein CHELA41_21375 [Hyphomicrobiales bacterium]CAH1684478.1 hypothetical protein CHELA20_53552 [Hyphomicrobiales bacterium]
MIWDELDAPVLVARREGARISGSIAQDTQEPANVKVRLALLRRARLVAILEACLGVEYTPPPAP